MISEFEYASNCKLEDILYSDIHLWRYANIGKQTGLQYYHDPKNLLAICSDWMIQGRVESAFLSAKALAKELKISMNDR